MRWAHDAGSGDRLRAFRLVVVTRLHDEHARPTGRALAISPGHEPGIRFEIAALIPAAIPGWVASDYSNGGIMTPTATEERLDQAVDKTAVRPFRVNVPEA